MNMTNEIIENIKKKKFNEALKICERVENSSNKEIIEAREYQYNLI